MIGAFISDDYYLHFETEDIETLKRIGILLGKFYMYDNKLPKRKLTLECIVAVVNEATTALNINLDKEAALLKLTKRDFYDWLLCPDSSVLESGPSCRFASANVYVSSERSSQQYKSYIECFATM